MTVSLGLFDIILALTLVAIGLSVLLAQDLFQSIVLFIIFGMLLGVAWCRLEALDVALAEVGIGAGLTGALLLNTLATTSQPATPVLKRPPTELKSLWSPLACKLLIFTIVSVAALAAVVVPLAQSASVQRIPISEAVPDSGVTNPVTAVLLNFRAYDTLLEVTVLVAAVFAVLPVPRHVTKPDTLSVGPIIQAFVRLLVPLAILVAAYILWIGTKAPGGAFQAAAILAAVNVLMIVCGVQAFDRARGWRVPIVAGLVIFLLVGIGGIATGGYFLELSPSWAGPTIMLIESALTLSIALILIELFRSTSSERDENHANEVGNERTEAAGMRDTQVKGI